MNLFTGTITLKWGSFIFLLLALFSSIEGFTQKKIVLLNPSFDFPTPKAPNFSYLAEVAPP